MAQRSVKKFTAEEYRIRSGNWTGQSQRGRQEVFVGTNTTVGAGVYGGSAEGNNSGGGNMVVNTSDNRVTIASGATVNGSVFGGYATGQTLGREPLPLQPVTIRFPFLTPR